MAKKIWILEGYITPERMQKSLQDDKDLLEWAKEHGDEEQIETAKKMIAAYEKKMAEHPEGYWLGYVGRIKYGEFCWDAKDTLRWGKKDDMKFRVLKADIINPDKGRWPGNYENGVENPGVLRYLYATL